METPHQHAFPQNVPVYGLQNIRAGRFRPQIELGVEREELEGVMMMRAGGRSARPPITGHSSLVLSLNRPVGQLRFGWDTFRKLARRSRNIEYQPVQNVAGLSL